MAGTLCVGIDLGCDTLKLSYAYSVGKKTVYGKFETDPGVRQVAIPAVAYYDGAKGWIFGNDVEMGEEKSFINIVKIKSLLSLLYPKEGSEWGREVYPNQNYYYESDLFPKFYFPTTNRTLENFPDMIKKGRVFRAEGYTPGKVCELFFNYVAKIVISGVNRLSQLKNISFNKFRFSVVHPMYAGKKYVDELCELVRVTFGEKPYKVMDSARALSMFATSRGLVDNEEGILLFDMGEETVSTVKCFLNGEKKVVIEAAADHSAPIKIGGNDVDFNIAAHIEDAIIDRETVGSPSSGDPGHIHEEGLQTKQYLFLKEIKKAKMLLSIPGLEDIFKDGVPVSIHRDLYIQRTLTRDDLMRSIGITGNDKVAGRVAEYIVDECKRAVNEDVTKIFLTGGLTETYGFVEYLNEQLGKRLKGRKPKIKVCTFDDYVDDGDRFNIQSYEDSVYAPSVGAAIVALKDYDVSAGLTYSYGTYIICKTALEDTNGKVLCDPFGNRRMSDDRKYLLEIFADRGTAYDEKKVAEFSTSTPIDIYGGEPEEFFSVRLSESSIAKRKGGGEVKYRRKAIVDKAIGDKSFLEIGKPGTETRKAAEKKFQLTDLFGTEARIECSYGGREIKRVESGVKMREGIRIHPKKSVAEPFIENITKPGVYSQVIFKDGSSARVEVCKIQIGFSGIKNFKVKKS